MTLVRLFLCVPLLASSLLASELEWKFQPGTTKVVRFPVTFDNTRSQLTVALSSTGEKRRFTLQSAAEGRLLVSKVQEQKAGAENWSKAIPEAKVEYWPEAQGSLKALEEDGISPQTSLKRPISLWIGFDNGALRLWADGRIIGAVHYPSDVELNCKVEVQGEASAGQVITHERNADLYTLIELPIAEKTVSQLIYRDGIPFEVWDNGNKNCSLLTAQWPDVRRDPAGFNQAYDGVPYFVGDPRTPFAQIPNAGYSHAYLLIRAGDEPDTVPNMTLRIGRRLGGYSNTSQVLTRDYLVKAPVKKATRSGVDQYHMVKVPIAAHFPTLVEGNVLDVEFTKEVRLARRLPDPNSFRWRPLGLPSNIRIAAATFERSPVQFSVDFERMGNTFFPDRKPEAVVKVHNETGKPQSYSIEVTDNKGWSESLAGTLSAHQSGEHRVTLPGSHPGVHHLSAALQDANAQPLLNYETTYAVLPPPERHARSNSPFGINAGSGEHFTPKDEKALAALTSSIGMHLINNLKMPLEIRERHGLRQGYVISQRPGNGGADAILERRKERLEQHPDQLPHLLIFHEDGISGRHASRIPDLFHDRPPYQLDDEERARFDTLLADAIKGATLVRKEAPEVQIQLGNGGLSFREELYRHKFPAELFDAGGNENPTFSRPPETQPPDPIGNNSSLWMDRQMLDHYGYGNKPVTQCHETIFPSTNPGNLSYETQAAYYVRHFLHSLAWNIPHIRAGSLMDKGNSYKNSNWGQTGLFTSRPMMAPKPAAAHVAALTWVLDGASYAGFLETGSDSSYLMHFTLRDGSNLYPFWCVRGSRPVHLSINGAQSAEVISAEGSATSLKIEGNELKLTAQASPAYLKLPAGSKIISARCGKPTYEPAHLPETVVATSLPLKEWQLSRERNALLENYNPLTPRRQGNFKVEEVEEFEGRQGVLAITPEAPLSGKATQPMIGELMPKKPLNLPGKPTHLGLWVNGNSSWGRIIVELKDASGQTWTSIGARAKGGGSPWMADWLGSKLAEKYQPGEVADWNTDDAWGLSRINFDGWNRVTIPLPGNYPGEAYPWPANSQWRSDKDGIVHYPFTLSSIIVELPERVLHLTRYEPPKRSSIYLGSLVILSDPEINAPKTASPEYVKSSQIDVR